MGAGPGPVARPVAIAQHRRARAAAGPAGRARTCMSRTRSARWTPWMPAARRGSAAAAPPGAPRRTAWPPRACSAGWSRFLCMLGAPCQASAMHAGPAAALRPWCHTLHDPFAELRQAPLARRHITAKDPTSPCARRAHAQGGWHGVCFLRDCVCIQSGEGLAACHQAALSTPSAGCRPGPSPDTPRASAGLQSIQNRASSAPPSSRSSWG